MWVGMGVRVGRGGGVIRLLVFCIFYSGRRVRLDVVFLG